MPALKSARAKPERSVVAGFVVPLLVALRRAGVPVSSGEAVDAVRALQCTETVGAFTRTTLRCTLVKRQEHVELFDQIVDRLLADSRRKAAPASPADVRDAPREDNDVETPKDADLLRRLGDALEAGDERALRELAVLAVAEYGDLDSAAAASARSHAYRVMRRMDLAALHQRAMRAALQGVRSPVERAIIVGEISALIELLRKRIAAEVQLSLHPDRLANAYSTPEAVSIDDLGIVAASQDQLRQMREALRPLARRLAARARRRRERRRRGRLDVRRTVRGSLSTGGVPLRPVFRRPRVSHPELVLLCDLSGSMAEFASFLMAFLTAISQELMSVRTFVFVDGIDEITDLSAAADGALEPKHLLARANVIDRDGHSDYGRVFSSFTARWPDAITPRATIIVAGDARTNYRDDGAETLADIARRVRSLRWFNPEPAEQWDTLDSAMGHYRRSCQSVHEVGTLRQLEHAVEAILATGSAL